MHSSPDVRFFFPTIYFARGRVLSENGEKAEFEKVKFEMVDFEKVDFEKVEFEKVKFETVL